MAHADPYRNYQHSQSPEQPHKLMTRRDFHSECELYQPTDIVNIRKLQVTANSYHNLWTAAKRIALELCQTSYYGDSIINQGSDCYFEIWNRVYNKNSNDVTCKQIILYDRDFGIIGYISLKLSSIGCALDKYWFIFLHSLLLRACSPYSYGI